MTIRRFVPTTQPQGRRVAPRPRRPDATQPPLDEQSIFDMKTMIKRIDPFREDVVERVSASVTARRNAILIGGAVPMLPGALGSPIAQTECKSVELDIEVIDPDSTAEPSKDERDTLAASSSTASPGSQTTVDEKPDWREK